MAERRYVIIGNGFAGTTCAEQLRKIDASASIIMFADEPYPLYNRIALPPMLRKQIAEAKVIIEAWRRHYNEVRPHSSLGYLTPNEFVARQQNAATCHATGQGAAVSGPPRPGPLHHPPRKGQIQQVRGPVSS